jgi:hypothetical protein
MVRELMPPTAGNAERFQRWSERFHEMEGGEAPAAEPAVEDDEPAETHEDVHEHGSPTRRKRR